MGSKRKPIILIGAPSGAGKTELSQQIIANALPFFSELCGHHSVAVVRHDLKLLPEDLPRDQIHIIECATHQFEQMQRRYSGALSHFLRDCELVIHVNLDIAKRIVVRQYFRRIFTGPQRLNRLQRVLQLSKYRRVLGYLLTRQLKQATVNWAAFGRALASDNAAHVALVRAHRVGDGYQFVLESEISSADGQVEASQRA
jgi:hypothetical protein